MEELILWGKGCKAHEDPITSNPYQCGIGSQLITAQGNLQQILNMLLVQQLPPTLPESMEPAVKVIVANALQHEAWVPHCDPVKMRQVYEHI